MRKLNYKVSKVCMLHLTRWPSDVLNQMLVKHPTGMTIPQL